MAKGPACFAWRRPPEESEPISLPNPAIRSEQETQKKKPSPEDRVKDKKAAKARGWILTRACLSPISREEMEGVRLLWSPVGNPPVGWFIGVSHSFPTERQQG